MATFWKHVNRVIDKSDIVIEVLDARHIEETRNIEVEEKILRRKKKILYVINKSDLVSMGKLKGLKMKLRPSVFVSSKDHLGTTILKKKILEMSRGEKVVVGVLGYPNVGKSSLINALSGKGSAKTSSESGYTKGMQKVRADGKILLIDTPGVFPKKEKDAVKHGKTGAIDYSKIKDAEHVVLKLIEEDKEKIVKHYGVSGEGGEEILENIAFKFKKLGKGGVANVDVAARMVLKDWQKGKIK